MAIRPEIRQRFFSRRSFLQNSILTASALSGRRLLAQLSSDGPIVHTAQGMLRGLRQDGVRVFRGVPFAEPPIGPLRFRRPEPKKAWSGERDATAFGASPMQKGEPDVRHSEDCLYLNVWAPEGKGPFPVFVWIHGGGFTDGHAFEPIYDGSEFAREGIVCISVAYRLGVFGFLDLEPVLGHEYADSANNGLRDLMLALEWIQENVSSFGGDPGRVTIGGESAGAKLSDILMGIPSASGLFHQVISESGGAERVWSRAVAAGVGQGFAEAWEKGTSKAVATLLSEPAASIVPVQTKFLEDWPQHFPLRPEMGGSLMTELPVQAVAGGSARGKRILIGTNRDESALFLGPHPKNDPVAQNLGNMGLAAFQEVFAKYKAVYPQMTDEERRIRAVTAEEYWIPTIRLADAHVKAGGSAWIYQLDFSETSGRFSGEAYHSLDVGLVWDKPHANVSNATAETALAVQIHQAWCAFIRGEVPAADGLPAWPAYDRETRATMMLDTKSYVEDKPQEAELRLWDGKL